MRLFTTEPELAAEALSAIHICNSDDGIQRKKRTASGLPAVFGARAAFYAEPISDIAGPVVSIAVYALCIRRILDFPADLARCGEQVHAAILIQSGTAFGCAALFV